ncbi:alanine racemase [Verticiella sediminum]|nr:alanine racemase [Verticiella sediminum]
MTDIAPGADRPLARPNVFEIDLAAVASCTRAIRDLIGPRVHFTATLKANAYGYGVLPVARTVLRASADALALANLEDAVALREAGIREPILVYAGVLPDTACAAALRDHDLTATLHSEESRRAHAALAGPPLKVAVKVDIGPERIGVPASTAAGFIQRVAGDPRFRLEAVNAHPNLPADADPEALAWQYRRFLHVRDAVARLGVNVPRWVLASSRVLRLTGTAMALNAVDPGDALFSPLHSADDTAPSPFHRLSSRLIQVRTVERDAYLADANFAMRPGMRVGIFPLGYSDGMRALHAGCVLVNGRRVPLAGPPALEYTRVDLTQAPGAMVGDEVVVVGAQGGERISPAEAVRHQGAARVADLAMQVGPGVVRRYLPDAAQAPD